MKMTKCNTCGSELTDHDTCPNWRHHPKAGAGRPYVSLTDPVEARQSVSLHASQWDALEALADESYGGNVSAALRALIAGALE